MRRMRWEPLACLLGGGLALTALCLAQTADSGSRWSGGILCVAESDPRSDGSFVGRWTPAGFFPLPPGHTADTVRALEARRPGPARALRRDRQAKVLGLPVLADVVDEAMLASGRLPIAGQPELLAGHRWAAQEQLTIGGRTFDVVGVLKAAPSPLGRAYLLELHENNARMFRPASDVRPVVLLSGAEAAKAVSECAADEFTAVAGVTRVSRGRYYGALLGFVLLVAGGGGLLLAGATVLAPRGPSALSDALEDMQRYRWLLVTLHAAFFGTVVLGMLVAYEVPVVQDGLLFAIGEQLTAESGLLAVAGRAYESGNFLLAAMVTFALNFGAGSIGMITLPSFVVPGCGAVLVLFRALLWGVTLAPARSDLATVMVPHNLTLLLEGEG
jgi:hypothetical protein